MHAQGPKQVQTEGTASDPSRVHFEIIAYLLRCNYLVFFIEFWHKEYYIRVSNKKPPRGAVYYFTQTSPTYL